MEYLTYKKFSDKQSVEELVQILQHNQIEYRTEEEREILDSLYVGGTEFNKQFIVKIKNDDFQKADSILLAISEKELDTVDENHYLYAFSNDELFDIISKPDEWNEFDYQLSKKILKERGKEINENTLGLLKNKRIKDLKAPEDGPRAWIYAGYLFAILGGLLGIFMGLSLMTAKKVLPNGQKVFIYSAKDRNHGTLIFFIGLIMFAIISIARIMTTDF